MTQQQVNDYLHALDDAKKKGNNGGKLTFGNPLQDALTEKAKGIVGYKEPTPETGFPRGKPQVGSVDPIGKVNKPPAVKPRVGAVDPLSNLPTAQRNAYTALTNLLNQYGLGSVAPKLLDYIKRGYDSDSLSYLMQQTPEFKKRFSANDVRVKNGMAPLSPAEYIATERSYRSVLQAAGLPQGFYDSPNDFTSLISSDISPTELKTRADYAFRFAQNGVDPNVKDQLREYYGINDTHLAAYFLDPSKQTAVLERQARSAEIGGALKSAGLDIGKGRAESYADLGVNYQQAQTGASNAGMIRDEAENAGQRFHSPFDDGDLADAEVAGLASARRKLRTIAESEAGLFAGQAGSPGAFSNNSGGAY